MLSSLVLSVHVWVPCKEFTRGAAIFSPRVQHSLRKQPRGLQRKQAESGAVDHSWHSESAESETEYRRNWTFFSPTQWFLTFFYISYPFIEQDYEIYPQYTQWCSFIENTKLKNCYSLEWFINIYIGCNLWLNKFTPRVNLLQVKNHWSKRYETPWRLWYETPWSFL